MTERVNPFKAFIDKSRDVADKSPLPSTSAKSTKGDAKLTTDASGIESGMMDLSLLAMGEAETAEEVAPPFDDGQPDPVSTEERWVQYLDDETGMPYWYNELTGEAKWAEEYQTSDENAPQVQVDGGAWERFYDDEGNPYYYNHETGQSDWEIPADAVLINTTEDDNNMEYMRGEDLEQSHESLKSALKKGPSFKSVRSARSFGLTSKSFRVTTFSDRVTMIEDQVSIDRMNSSKSLKSTLSFKLNKKASFVVNDQLKPKTPTPNKTKAKNGFQILKEGATVLREKRGEDGVLWREYQAVDDGPVFYATEVPESGQWGKPDVFFEKSTKSRSSKGDESGSISPESSLEMSNEVVVVDFFALDKEDVFSLQTPQAKLPTVDEQKKTTPMSIAMLTEQSNPQSSPVLLPALNVSNKEKVVEAFSPNSSRLSSASSSAHSLVTPNKAPAGGKPPTPNQSASKALPIVNKEEKKLQPLLKPESSSNLLDASSSAVSTPNPTPTPSSKNNPVPTDTPPPTAISLKIKNIQDEALVELQRLRSKLESAKQEFKTGNPSVPVTPATPPVASLPAVVATTPTVELPATFTSSKLSSSASTNNTPVVSAKPSMENVLPPDSEKKMPPPVATPVASSLVEKPPQEKENTVMAEQEKSVTELDKVIALPVTTTTPMVAETDKSLPRSGSSAGNELSSLKIDVTAAEDSSIKKRPGVVLEDNPFTLDTPVKRKKDMSQCSQSEWMEVVCRSQMLDMKNGWLVLYDLDMATKFYRRMSDGFCQLQQPADLEPEVKKMEEAVVVQDDSVKKVEDASPRPLKEQEVVVSNTVVATESTVEVKSVTPKLLEPGDAKTTEVSPTLAPAAIAEPSMVPIVTTVVVTKADVPVAEVAPVVLLSDSASTSTSADSAVAKKGESIIAVNTTEETKKKEEEDVIPAIIVPPKEDNSAPVSTAAPATSSPSKSAKKRKDKVVVDPLSADFNNFPINSATQKTDLHIDIEHSAFTASPLASNKSTAASESNKKAAFSMDTMIEDLAYVEKRSAANFHAFLQRDYQNQDNEANLLLQRLQALHTNRLTATTIEATELEEDDAKKLHAKCRKLLERCCYVVEGIDMSSVEHMANSKQVFRAAVHQRYALASASGAVRDLRHDAVAMPTTPKHMISPSSILLNGFWKTRKVYQGHHAAWSVYMNTHELYASVNTTTSASAKKQPRKWYRNKHFAHSMQTGEPFDFLMQKFANQMKRELWSDFIVNAFVDQHALEHIGVELLEDMHHGYLYYCPIRKEYSSHGRFHPFPKSKSKPTSSSTGTINTTVHDWSERIHQHRLQKLLKTSTSQNIWKKFDLSACLLPLQDDNTTSFALSQSMSRHTSTQGRQQVHQSLDKYRSSFKQQQQQQQQQQTASRRNSAASMVKSASSKRMSVSKVVEEDEEEEDGGQQRPSAWLAKDDANSLPYNADNWAVLQDAFAIAHQDFTTLKYSATDVAAYRLHDLTDNDASTNKAGDTFMTSMGWQLDTDNNTGNDVDLAAAQQQQQEDEELYRMLKFEEHLSAEAYTKYQQLLLKISVTNPENPLPVLELMEFLLYEGLGKATLAVFKHATDMMKASNTFDGMQFEYALGHVLSMQLSRRYFNYYENSNHMLTLLHMYGHDSVFILTMCASYFQSVHQPEMAESLYMAALMKEPSSVVALLKYGQFLAIRGEWRTALRYYHRLHDIHPSNHASNNAVHAMLRQGRLEEAWLQELLQVDTEGVIVGYKKCLASSGKDRMQSTAMHSLASFQHSVLKPKSAVLEYYHRALQVDDDNAIAHLLLASYSAVHQAQNKAQAASNILQQLTPSPSSSASQQAAPSATKRPQSAKATAAASTKKTSTAAEFEGKNKLKASSARPSSAAPTPPASIPTTTSADSYDPQYAPWNKAYIDSSYRRALVLMPDASYRWMALLAYGDFILLSLQDVQRAKDYYEEACRLSFHTEITPILALGHCYHYVIQDYRRARKVYLRALRSRHGNLAITDLLSFDSFHKPIKSSNGLMPDDGFEYLGPPMSPSRNNPARTKVDMEYEQSLIPSANRLDCIPLYTAIAYLLWDMNEVEAAKRFAMATLRLQRSFSPALRLIGLISFFQQDARLAAKYFSAAASSAYSNNSSTAEDGSRSNATASPLQKSMTNVLAMRCHGLMKAIKGSYDQAIQLLDKSIAVSPLCFLSHRVNAILSYVYRQQVDKAYLHLQQAYDISQQDDIESLRCKAQILMDQKQFEEARLLLLDVIQKVPFDVISLVNIAWCVHHMQKVTKKTHRSSVASFNPFGNTTFATEDDDDEDFFTFYDSKLQHAQSIQNSSSKKTVFNRETLTGSNLQIFAQSKDPKELLEIAKSLAFLLTEGGSQPYAEGLLQHMMEADRRKVKASTEESASKSIIDDSKHSDTSMMAYVYFWYAVYHFSIADSQTQSSFHEAKQFFQLAAYPSLAATHLGQANSQHNSIPFESMNNKEHRQDRAHNNYYPLAIYYLGIIAENEGDISAAERFYEEAVRSAAKQPFTLLRVIAMAEDALLSVRDKLHKKNGKKAKKKGKKGNKASSKKSSKSLLREDDQGLDAQPSDVDFRRSLEPAASKLDPVHLQHSSSSSSYFESLPGGHPQQTSTTSFQHLPRVGIAGTDGFFTPVRDSWQDLTHPQQGEFGGAMQSDMHAKNSSVLNLNSVSRTSADLFAQRKQPAEEEDGEDEDDEDFDALQGFEQEPALTMKDLQQSDQQDPAARQEMANLLKRVMMHQRVLEAALVHKFSSQKSMKDLGKVTIPKKTFLHFEHDWLERALYALGKSEDWATLYLCMKEAVL